MIETTKIAEISMPLCIILDKKYGVDIFNPDDMGRLEGLLSSPAFRKTYMRYIEWFRADGTG